MSVTKEDITHYKVGYEQYTKEYSKEIVRLLQKSELLLTNDKASLQSILKLMEDDELDKIDKLLNELMEDLGIKKNKLLDENKKFLDILKSFLPKQKQIILNLYDYIKLKRSIKSKKKNVNIIRNNKIDEIANVLHKLQIDIIFKLLTTEDYLLSKIFQKIFFIKTLPIIYTFYTMKHLLLNYWVAILLILFDNYKLNAYFSKKGLLFMDKALEKNSKNYSKIKKSVNNLFSKSESKVSIILKALEQVNLKKKDHALREKILRDSVNDYHDILENELSVNQSKNFFKKIKNFYEKINELNTTLNEEKQINKPIIIRNLYDEINIKFDFPDHVNKINYEETLFTKKPKSFSSSKPKSFSSLQQNEIIILITAFVFLLIKFQIDEKRKKAEERVKIKSSIEQRLQETTEEIKDIIVTRLNILLHSKVKTMKEKTGNLSYLESLF